MESNRILEQCLAMYKNRLDNLSKIMAELYQVIKSDEVLPNLKDSSMEKYKIGRVNQIVQDVLNSEKQRLLIRALQKCAELNIKVKQLSQQDNVAKASKKQNYYEGLFELKQKCDKQIASLNSIIEEKTKTIAKLNKQNLQLNARINEQNIILINASNMESCSKCQRLAKALTEVKSQLDLNKKFAQKITKDGQVAIQSLMSKIETLTQKNNHLEAEKQRKNLTSHNKEDISLKNDQLRRNQKMEVIRNEMVYLEEQLIEVQKQFNMIKQFTVGSVLHDLKKVKNEHSRLKECLSNYQYQLAKDLSNFAQEVGHKLEVFSLKKEENNFKPQNILAKLNHIENQIDYFLQSQVLAE